MCKTGLIINDIADHCANFILLTGKNQNVKEKIANEPIRNFSKSNIAKFNNLLDSANWDDIYYCSDPNIALDYFISRLTPIHDSCFPFIKSSKKFDSGKRWITPALIKSINTKCKLHKKWIKTRKRLDETKYKKYTNLLGKLLRIAKNQYYSKLFDAKIQNIKNIWKNVNALINKNSSNNSNINKIIRNGLTINNSSDIANSFNDYFCDIGNNLHSQSLNNNTTNRSSSSYKNYFGPSRSNSFFCSDITLSELLATVNNLKQSSSCVGSFMSSSLLKNCIDHIAEPLLFIFNLSFDKGVFPEQLKLSRVIPIFKKGSKMNMSNFRPISITNPLGKVLEKLMHTRMTSYLEKFNILYDYQFGFRKSYSTSIAVIDVVNMIEKELHDKKFVLGIFMNLQKAFDTINLNILLDKLHHYGFRETSFNWFKTYLIGRSQFTVVNGEKSLIKITNCGVPQGTVLGPLLFLLYINDITRSVNKSQIKLFADDSNLFVVSDDLKTLFDIANNELTCLSQWISANKFFINYDKTNFMVFDPISRTKKKNNNALLPYSLLFNDHVITQVHCVKYLGVMIDDEQLI